MKTRWSIPLKNMGENVIGTVTSRHSPHLLGVAGVVEAGVVVSESQRNVIGIVVIVSFMS